MSETLSLEGQRMCEQCCFCNSDGTCKDGINIETQNARAVIGVCNRAGITGGTLGLPYHKIETVLGDMERNEKGDWVFRGKNYNRLSKGHCDTDSNEWPT